MHTVNIKLHANQFVKIGDNEISICDIKSIVMNEKFAVEEVTLLNGTVLLPLWNCPECGQSPIKIDNSEMVTCPNTTCKCHAEFYASGWQRMITETELGRNMYVNFQCPIDEYTSSGIRG